MAKREQQALDRHELVPGLVGELLGGVERARQLRGEVDLAGAAAGDLGALRQRPFDGRPGVTGPPSGLLDDARGQALGVVEEDLQQVVGSELLVAVAQGQALRRLHEALRAIGVNLSKFMTIPPRHGGSPRWARQRRRIGVRPSGSDTVAKCGPRCQTRRV